MVVFHSSVLFIPEPTMSHVIRALDFIGGSWVFISGLIVALHYAPRFMNAPRFYSIRLCRRGIKVLLVFGVLNLLIIEAGLSRYPGPFDWQYVWTVLTAGGGHLSSFEVLLGIAYMLMLSPILLVSGRTGLYLGAALVLGIGLMGESGYTLPTNVWVVLCGVGGYVCGVILRHEAFGQAVASKQKRAQLLVVAVGAIATYYMLVFQYEFSRIHLHTYLLGIAGILGTSYLLYPVVRRAPYLEGLLRLCGRYSLVAYIWQMGVIWSWHGIARATAVDVPFVIDFAIVFSVLLVSLWVLDATIRHDWRARRAYELVFN